MATTVAVSLHEILTSIVMRLWRSARVAIVMVHIGCVGLDEVWIVGRQGKDTPGTGPSSVRMVDGGYGRSVMRDRKGRNR